MRERADLLMTTLAFRSSGYLSYVNHAQSRATGSLARGLLIIPLYVRILYYTSSVPADTRKIL